MVQVSPQVSEGHLELQLLLGQRLHLLDEVLESRLELVPHFALHLLRVQVVPVVHVLVLAQVRGDLAHLRVELDVRVAPLAEHDGVLEGRGGEGGGEAGELEGFFMSLMHQWCCSPLVHQCCSLMHQWCISEQHLEMNHLSSG